MINVHPFISTKVNYSNSITLNIMKVNLQCLCNPRHGWLKVCFPHEFFITVQEWKNNLSTNNRHSLIFDSHNSHHNWCNLDIIKKSEVGLNHFAITYIPHISNVRHFMFQVVQNHIPCLQRCLDIAKKGGRV